MITNIGLLSFKSFFSFRQWWFVYLYLFVFFSAACLVSIHRFYQFDVFYFDHAIFDQALWKVAQFEPGYIDHYQNEPLLQIGDHFNPTFYLLTPLYWVTDRYEPLFILQNLFVTGSAFVVFLIVRDRVKSGVMVFALVLAYTLFIGMQNALISAFHTELPALFTLSLALYGLDKQKWKLYWVMLLLTFGLKETFPAIGIGIAVYLLLKRSYRVAIATGIVSIVYYLFATRIAIPYLSTKPYFYVPVQYDHLYDHVIQFFYPFIKTETLLVGLLTFGMLPLFSIPFLPAILQDYYVRFVMSNTPARIDLGLHYNVMATLLLAFGSVQGLVWLRKYEWYNKVMNWHGLAIIAIVLVFHVKLYTGPLGLSYNPAFYSHSANMTFLNDFIDQIPANGKVMAPNNLAVQMTHTHDVMLIRNEYWIWMPDVIAMDFRDGQNPNNYWRLHSWEIDDFKQRLLADPNYETVKVTDEQLYFVKNNTVDMSWYDRITN